MARKLLKVVPKVEEKASSKAVKKTSGVKRLTRGELGRCAEEYKEISSQIKVLDDRKKQLATLLKEGAVQYGVKDDKGSSFIEVNGYVVGNVCKVSMSIDQSKAVPFLEKKGLGDLVDVVEVRTVNEERLTKAVGEKRLTLREVESFTNKSNSYSVSVQKIEDMPEVEQSSLSLAASRR